MRAWNIDHERTLALALAAMLAVALAAIVFSVLNSRYGWVTTEDYYRWRGWDTERHREWRQETKEVTNG